MESIHCAEEMSNIEQGLAMERPKIRHSHSKSDVLAKRFYGSLDELAKRFYPRKSYSQQVVFLEEEKLSDSSFNSKTEVFQANPKMTLKEFSLLVKLRKTRHTAAAVWLKNLYQKFIKIQIRFQNPRPLFTEKNEGKKFQIELIQSLEAILTTAPCTLNEQDLQIFVSLMEILREMEVLDKKSFKAMGMAYLNYCLQQQFRYEQDFFESLVEIEASDKKEVIMKEELTNQQEHLKPDFTVVVQCVICFDELRNCLYLPCKHLLTCESCSQKCDYCPCCRSKITEKIKVYMS